MNFCNDESISTKAACVGNFMLTEGDCSMMPTLAAEIACQKNPNGTAFPRIWAPLPYNFDNIGYGFVTVFEITSGEMWPDIMYSVVDTNGVQPPLRENKPFAAALFIVMILTSSFLMFNVFVGVVIDNFNKMKDRQEGMDLLTDSQRKWRQTMLHTMQMDPMTVLRPPLNAGPIRLKIFHLVESKEFELFIISSIMVNVISWQCDMTICRTLWPSFVLWQYIFRSLVHGRSNTEDLWHWTLPVYATRLEPVRLFSCCYQLYWLAYWAKHG